MKKLLLVTYIFITSNSAIQAMEQREDKRLYHQKSYCCTMAKACCFMWSWTTLVAYPLMMPSSQECPAVYPCTWNLAYQNIHYQGNRIMIWDHRLNHYIDASECPRTATGMDDLLTRENAKKEKKD